MNTRLAGALLAGLLVLPLAGCGGSEQDAYCTRLSADQEKISEMTGGASGLLANLPMLHDLAEAAPSDLVDEWQTFVNAVEGLDDALKAAGVEPGDFENGQAPKGLSVAQRKAISEAADVVSSDAVVAAANGIEQQARDVCKLQLGL